MTRREVVGKKKIACGRAGCDQRLHHNVQAIVAPSHGICVIESRSQPRTKMATFISETKENDESTFNQVAAGTVMIRYTRLTVARRTEGAKLRRRIISSQRKSTFRYFVYLYQMNVLNKFRGKPVAVASGQCHCQSPGPGRMKNSSYYIAPVGVRTHDLPHTHTAASNMVKVSYALTREGRACGGGRVVQLCPGNVSVPIVVARFTLLLKDVLASL